MSFLLHLPLCTTSQQPRNKKSCHGGWGLGVCHVYSFSFRGVQRLLWQQPKVMMMSSWEWTCLIEELHHRRPPNSCTNLTWHFGDKPRARTQHLRPDGRQHGRQDRRQEKNKTRETSPEWRPDGRQDKDKTTEVDTASQAEEQVGRLGGKLGDKPETRQRQDQGGEHSIPGWRVSWETGRQVGRHDWRQGKHKTRETDTASQPRRTHLRQQWEPQQ